MGVFEGCGKSDHQQESLAMKSFAKHMYTLGRE